MPGSRLAVGDASAGRGRIFALVLLAVFAASVPAGAISTDPVLILTRVTADVGASSRIVRLEGVLPAEDLVQLPFPLHVLIRETQLGTGYVRYDLSNGAVSGSSATLSDGLDPGDAAALVLEGSPAPDARVVLLARGRIEVLLPDAFPSGSAEAVLFTIHEGETILSNPISFEIEAAAP